MKTRGKAVRSDPASLKFYEMRLKASVERYPDDGESMPAELWLRGIAQIACFNGYSTAHQKDLIEAGQAGSRIFKWGRQWVADPVELMNERWMAEDQAKQRASAAARARWRKALGESETHEGC